MRFAAADVDGVHGFAHARVLERASAAQTWSAESLHDPNMIGGPVDDWLPGGCGRPQGGPVSELGDPGVRAEALLAEAAAACESQTLAEVLEEAREVREAEWARCGLADRLRAVAGPVRLDLARLFVRGWVEGAGPDLVVVDDGRDRYGIRMHGVLAITGLGPALAEERPAHERVVAVRWAAHVRDLVGDIVRVHRTDGSTLVARVRAAAMDHFDAIADDSPASAQGVVLTIPYAAVELMTSRSRMGASTRSSGSRRTCG